jgi:hypothetical protein
MSTTNNINFIKHTIRKTYLELLYFPIDEDNLDTIINEYKILRDTLKKTINSTTLDKHKILACLSISIINNVDLQKFHIKNNNIDYVKFAVTYLICNTILKSIHKRKKVLLKGQKPIFKISSKLSYEEDLFSFLVKTTNKISRDTECLLSISHVFYLIEELWYQQSIIWEKS